MTTLYRWLWYLVPANPILLRVLHGGSRRVRHLWVRMGYLGALIVLVLFGLMTGGGFTDGPVGLGELAKSGTQVFAIVSYGQVVLVCLLAPLFMAGAIGEEQAGETFDILLTTPLSNLQIVLGSLMGRLFFVLSLLFSGLPLFAVLLIFGGVPIRSVFVAFAVAALVAVTVGSVAITLAVLRKGGRKAVYIFVISIAGYLVATYAVDKVIRMTWRSAPAATTAVAAPAGGAPAPAPLRDGRQTTWITPLHPLLVLEASLNTANYRPPSPEELAGRWGPVRFYLGNPLGAFATMSGVISLLLVLFSATQVRRLGQNAGTSALPAWLRRALRLSDATGERRRPPRTVWANPVAWSEAHARGNRVGAILARWSFTALGLVAAIVLVLLYHYGKLPRLTDATSGRPLQMHEVFKRFLLTLILIELAVIVLVGLYMSAGCVSREREDGTLDLLLTTPITPKNYIWGKVRGLVSFLTTLLAAPVLTLAVVSVYTLIGSANGWASAAPVVHNTSTGTRFDTLLILPEAPVLLIIMLVPFIAFSVTMGLRQSIKCGTVITAVIWSLVIVGGVGGVLSGCGFAAMPQIPIFGAWISAFGPAANVVMLIYPWDAVDGFATNPVAGRANLFMAALIAGAVYAAFVWGFLGNMVSSFDQTVRPLTGTK